MGPLHATEDVMFSLLYWLAVECCSSCTTCLRPWPFTVQCPCFTEGRELAAGAHDKDSSVRCKALACFASRMEALWEHDLPIPGASRAAAESEAATEEVDASDPGQLWKTGQQGQEQEPMDVGGDGPSTVGPSPKQHTLMGGTSLLLSHVVPCIAGR